MIQFTNLRHKKPCKEKAIGEKTIVQSIATKVYNINKSNHTPLILSSNSYPPPSETYIQITSKIMATIWKMLFKNLNPLLKSMLDKVHELIKGYFSSLKLYLVSMEQISTHYHEEKSMPYLSLKLL